MPSRAGSDVRLSRRLARSAAVLLATALLWPAGSLAHGIVQRQNLPIPEWLFGWAAALVLVVSFAALAALWPEPRLEGEVRWRPLPWGLGALLGSRPVEILCGAIGVALLPVLVVAGFVGPPTALENLEAVFVFITFWVGVVFASVLFGDVFRAFNPWRAIGRATGWVLRGWAPGRRPYPEWLGHWPAAATLLFFTWMELVGNWSEQPHTLSWAVIGYTVLTLAAQAILGVEAWSRRGEGFSVYFNLFSRMSAVETRERVVGLRPPLAGLPRLEPVTGTVALVCVMIGTVTFDGLSQGPLWKDLLPDLVDAARSLGASPTAAPKVVGTAGLLFGVGLVAGFYWLGTEGARSVGGGMTAERLRRGFVHSLVPIAAVYVAAHYFTFLLNEGQAIRYLASDPFGDGWDLFGTASSAIDYQLISQNGAWYVEVAFVVVGHVCALVLAHDRALAMYSNARTAVRSQYWMLGVMVGFTTLALWLLAQAGR
jgi:hypothetical protein